MRAAKVHATPTPPPCQKSHGPPLNKQPRSQGPLSYSRERTLVEAGHVTAKISQNLGGKKNATHGRGSKV